MANAEQTIEAMFALLRAMIDKAAKEGRELPVRIEGFMGAVRRITNDPKTRDRGVGGGEQK